MALADKFNRVMQETIRAQIAWLPVANTFKVGDFGLISHGVFVRMASLYWVFSETEPKPEPKKKPAAKPKKVTARSAVRV